MAAVSERTGVSVENIVKKTKVDPIMHARHLCAYFLKKYTSLSLKRIGEIISEPGKPRDHTTMLHSVKTVKDLYDAGDELIVKDVDAIEIILVGIAVDSDEYSINVLLSDISNLLSKVPCYEIPQVKTMGQLSDYLKEKLFNKAS